MCEAPPPCNALWLPCPVSRSWSHRLRGGRPCFDSADMFSRGARVRLFCPPVPVVGARRYCVLTTPARCSPDFARRCPSSVPVDTLCVPKPRPFRPFQALVPTVSCSIAARRAAHSLSLSLIFLCSGLQPQASHSASSAPDHAHHGVSDGTGPKHNNL